MTCPDCGETYIGDGYSRVYCCPNTHLEESPNYEAAAYAAPDEGPFPCGFSEDYAEWLATGSVTEKKDENI